MVANDNMAARDQRHNRREMFAGRQAQEARLFELREKVAAAIADAVAPLTIDAREAESAIHIQVRGGVGLPEIHLELDGCGVRDTNDKEFGEAECAAGDVIALTSSTEGGGR